MIIYDVLHYIIGKIKNIYNSDDIDIKKKK